MTSTKDKIIGQVGVILTKYRTGIVWLASDNPPTPRVGETLTHNETKKALLDILSKIEREMIERVLEVIGEDETPEEYIPKALTDSELSMATHAVQFHARNKLRQELKDKLTQEFIKK